MKPSRHIALLIPFVFSLARADILYVAGRTNAVRVSYDSGLTWSDFISGSPAYFQGIAVAGTPANHTVFLAVTNLNTPTNRPIYAYQQDGTFLDSATFVDGSLGFGHHRPLAFHDGYVYVNANNTNQLVQFSGSSFSSPTTQPAFLGITNYVNDIAFATNSGLKYFFGFSLSTNFTRFQIEPNGSLTNFTGLNLQGANIQPRDAVFTANNRLIVLSINGIWMSGPNAAFTHTTIVMTQLVAFSSGFDDQFSPYGEGRECALVGTNLYVISTKYAYRYSLDEENGTVSLIHSAQHGLDTSTIQLAVIPEPYTIGSLLLGLACITRFIRDRERSRRAQKSQYEIDQRPA